jgi:hypothetical protein
LRPCTLLAHPKVDGSRRPSADLGFLNDTYTPTLRGFDRYLGYYSGAEEHFTHEKVGFPAPHGEKGGFTAYDLANNSGPHVAPCVEPVGNGSATYSSFLYGNETLRLLAQHDPSIPLYVYLAWNNVHDPNEAPQQYVDLHDRIADVPRRKLSAMMSVLDDTLTAVIEGFKAKHMWDDTLFIFSTDNGGNLGGSGVNWPLRGGKYTCWHGGVGGVGLVGGGANILPDALRGSTWSGFVSQADWYSTFAALAGVTLDDTGPLPADGLNVFPAIIVNGSSPREEVPLQIWSTAEGNRVAPPPRDFCERFAGTDEGERCRPPTSVHAPDSAVARKRWRAAAAWHSHSHTQVEETELVSVRLGAIIRGRWKLIWGYPGWTKNWDGWIRAPGTTRGPKESHGDRRIASAGRAVPLLKPYNGTLCVKMPCLFDILSDPTEHHDVGDQHPQVVASLKARIQELMASEVTVEEAELCPTKMGSLPDPRGTAVAVASGFWQPWLNANA